jgi:monovalent cation/hydrogen antiporter
VVVFELILLLLLGAVLLVLLARRVGAPYPAFLAVGGAALALFPGAPQLSLEPDLALALFVAPVLLDAAFDTSVRDLKDNWLPVTGLVLVAVGLTTAGVAVVAHALVPGMPWSAAVALGAIVAPPDASAATAVLRQVRLPHRVLTILEGESLLNDAGALLIYRIAVGATLAGSLSLADVAPAFLLNVVGSIVAGPVLGWLSLKLTARIDDIPSAIVLQFVGTFGVWMLAQRAGLSAILTIVTYAITLARYAPRRTSARRRVPAYAVWDTAVFVLNVLAFALIGLQLRPILERLAPAQRTDYLVVAAAVLATVIVVRIAWVMAYNTGMRLKVRWFGFHPARPREAPTARGGFLVAWCGMRGIVTLAAALALPDGGAHPFPYRDLILLVAFCTVVGTLVLQGLTLGPLVRVLALHDDNVVEGEVRQAWRQALRAALAAVDGDQSPGAEALRREYQEALRSVEEQPAGPLFALPDDPVRRRALAAARQAVLGLRASGDIGDAAFHRVEEQLDRTELGVAEGDSAYS